MLSNRALVVTVLVSSILWVGLDAAGTALAELRTGRALQDLFGLIGQSITLLEREADVWAPRFKNVYGGALWQDIPLVGTLIGLAASRAVLGDRVDDRVRACMAEIRRATAGDPLWERPSKTQTATQWTFIATIALNTMRLLGVDPNEASTTLSWQFGQSGIAVLLQLETKAR